MTSFKFISGLANCHLPGLYSLVIREREGPFDGMRRVFYCSRECDMRLWEGADFRLKPHNHRQTIKLSRLFGEVNNVEVKFDRWGDYSLWRYGFSSALINGNFAVERMWCEIGAPSERPMPTSGVALHWSEVHTVTAKPHSAWIVEEFELAPAGCERVWAVSHELQLSPEGLYVPMTGEEIEEIAELVNGQ